MGRSLVPVAALAAVNELGSTVFEAQRLRYTVAWRSGRLFHGESARDRRGQVIGEREAEVAYAVGSGTHGYSFLVENQGYVFLSPISWYSAKKSWDLSPGYAENNFHFDRPATPNCLFCHAQHVEPVENTSNRYRLPLFRQSSIGCERCHDPGQLHVQSRRHEDEGLADDDTIVNPARLEPELREAVCQQCHLQGQTGVQRRGRETFDFRPGLPLHLFRSVFVWPPGRASGPKAVGQVEQMYSSRCFRSSAGQLGCISCHDPHRKPEASEKVAYFRERCLVCHARTAPCRLPPSARQALQDDCVRCHMPSRHTDIPHSSATDHRIRRRPDQEQARWEKLAPRQPGEKLIVNFYAESLPPGDPEAERNYGIALMNLAAGQLPPEAIKDWLAEQALPRLAGAVERVPDDNDAREALGFAQLLQGRPAEALASFETVLNRVPQRETALARAAAVAEELGRRNQALELWQRAIDVNPRQWQYHYHRAQICLDARDWAAALAACRAALQLDPFLIEVRMLQVRCLLAQGNREEAQTDFAELLSLKPEQADRLHCWFEEQTR
jgi:Flp pilus assembly protein TadD